MKNDNYFLVRFEYTDTDLPDQRVSGELQIFADSAAQAERKTAMLMNCNCFNFTVLKVVPCSSRDEEIVKAQEQKDNERLKDLADFAVEMINRYNRKYR